VDNAMMPLDLILNPKNVDPRNPESPRCIQLETAMGSAISAFEDAAALEVPRSRFAPVKTTADLMVVESDCYVRTEDQSVELAPQRRLPLPEIRLDDRFYKKIDEYEARFPEGVPSLLQAAGFTIEGDVRFEKGVEVHGEARVENRKKRQAVVAQGTRLEGETIFD
jgi:UTP--glucose-1-phosphate uridylyltransferase